jgi:adenosylmethionine-8-amino-7-oxononanoate aminotransferase
MKLRDQLEFDHKHLCHPYTSMTDPIMTYKVDSAKGVKLKLSDGRVLIDGMSSWWCVIHGYNNPVLNKAAKKQLNKMSHVMFGGLTHDPAIELAKLLIEIAPENLQHVFFSDSGSVSIEVAIKMAFQYWASLGKKSKNRLMTVRSGYHGDTFYAMSVCDPVTGMHHLFNEILPQNFFAPAAEPGIDREFKEEDILEFEKILSNNHKKIAAVILEPIVQGAGRMNFYAPIYLKKVRELCDKYDVLLIADEIATGFGRTGKLFACEFADISPDIMCVGKSLTGGYLSLAATLTTEKVAKGISDNEPGVFMHGPTFMANPLACAISLASTRLLLSSDYQQKVKKIEEQLLQELSPCAELSVVKDVRVLGAIGVVELHGLADMESIQGKFVNQGVWIRPFNNLVYIMPAFIMKPKELTILTKAIFDVVNRL